MRFTAVLALLLAVATADAQSIRLRQLATGATDIRAHVGDTLTIEVVMDLGDLHASGIALNISLPSEGVSVIDDAAARPFTPGLFVEGMEFANQQVPSDRIYGLPPSSSLLHYAVVLGPGDSRYRSGSGIVATFDVVFVAPVTGSIHLVDSAAHQSMVVLEDGRSEVAVREVTHIELAVSKPAGKRSSGSWAGVKTRHR